MCILFPFFLKKITEKRYNCTNILDNPIKYKRIHFTFTTTREFQPPSLIPFNNNDQRVKVAIFFSSNENGIPKRTIECHPTISHLTFQSSSEED